MRKLDSDLRIPKYIQLKEEIKRLIKENRLKPDDKLQSRSELLRDYDVSEITIRKAIDELTNEGYVYRVHGKGTFVASRKQDHMTIALVLPHLFATNDTKHMYDVGFLAPIVHAIEREAQNNGANILLYLDHDDSEVEGRNLRNIMERGIDAVIIVLANESQNIEYLHQLKGAGIPVVCIDRSPLGITVDTVSTDNSLGAYQAVNILIERGFETVYHFTCAQEIAPIRARLDGYVRAMSEHNKPTADLIKMTNVASNIAKEEKSAYHLACESLKSMQPCFGVFAANTPALVGVFRAIQDNGLRNDEFALACFDEPPVYIPEEILFVKVIQPLEEMGKRSLQIVMEKLGGSTEVQSISLEPSVCIANAGMTVGNVIYTS